MSILLPPTNSSEKKSEPIPLLRPDLKLQRAPSESDGSPMYTIYDPVTGEYFKISGVEVTIINEMKPGMSVEELLDNINSKSTAALSVQDIKSFFSDASQNNLLMNAKTSEQLIKESSPKKTNVFWWLLLHYLYIRIPLINPDPFLGKTLSYVTPLFSRKALTLYALISLSGIFCLFTRFDEFIHTFKYFFNMEGFFAYAFAITLIKIVHELSHAYVAKYYGVRVPSMGVALIVLWPVLYTDVTDSWKLPSRFQRLAISIAGVVAELVLAGLATWGWLLTEPGMLQSIFFLTASTTWISSLLINLNPLMRFDGYYILSDLWGVDNLQPRSFALARCELRRMFLGVQLEYPEDLPVRTRNGMVVYAVLTWMYRLSLYLVVALFVYYKFTKLLGVFLFLVEIGVFIIWPIIEEVGELIRLRTLIKFNWRLLFTMSALSLFLIWFAFPVGHRNKFSAIIIPKENQVFYAPQDAFVKSINITKGQMIAEGDVLFQLSSKNLESDIQSTLIEEKMVRREILARKQQGLKDVTDDSIPELQSKLSSIKSQIEQLLALQQRLVMKAAFSGKVYYIMDPLHVGQYVKRNDQLAKIANFQNLEAIAYVPEERLGDLKVGDKVTFKLSNLSTDVRGTIIKISPYGQANLEYSQLSSLFKGELPVTKDPETGKLLLIESYYEILVKLDNIPSETNIGQIGHIVSYNSEQSKLMTYLRRIYVQFWKESSL